MTAREHNREAEPGISLWQDTVMLKSWPRLEGVQGCDVLVIGGGMAGILTAFRLYQRGVDVVLAEGHRLGSGVTAGTTAKITSQHGLIYQKLLMDMGTEKSRMYLDINEAAIGEFAVLCSSHGIQSSPCGETDCQDRNQLDFSCGFRRQSNLIYSCRGAAGLEKEMDALEKLGSPACFRENLPLPFETDGAVEFPAQASIHPLKLVKRLTEEDCQNGRCSMRIFEKSRITRLHRWKDGGWEAVSEHGSILADQVVVASHFPFVDRHGGYFMKMYQSRSMVIAGKTFTEPLDDMYKDEKEGGLSFREAEGLLLIGGGSGRPGKKNDCAELFSPSRPMKKSGLLANAAESAVNLLKPAVPRCRHFGCALSWNEKEMTWDCPCHGSRYDEEGRCIEGPSTKDLF